ARYLRVLLTHPSLPRLPPGGNNNVPFLHSFPSSTSRARRRSYWNPPTHVIHISRGASIGKFRNTVSRCKRKEGAACVLVMMRESGDKRGYSLPEVEEALRLALGNNVASIRKE
ncbi:hypothetical protein KUCAC02_017039, partial [Chaenocephalus aceratus]